MHEDARLVLVRLTTEFCQVPYQVACSVQQTGLWSIIPHSCGSCRTKGATVTYPQSNPCQLGSGTVQCRTPSSRLVAAIAQRPNLDCGRHFNQSHGLVLGFTFGSATERPVALPLNYSTTPSHARQKYASTNTFAKRFACSCSCAARRSEPQTHPHKREPAVNIRGPNTGADNI